MRAPAFWWRAEPSFAARLLAPVGLICGAVAASRMGRPGAKAELPVICVGNLVAGGAGKTPTALLIAEMLRAMGQRPIFLSRGYGGALPGPVLVDAARHNARAVGDEPLLLARRAPTIVSRDRVAGAVLAAGTGATVLVMDDGLQNPSLQKSLTLAVVDGGSGIGNELCIPAGPLRAPLAAQWPRVDAVLVIGAGAGGDSLAVTAAGNGKPVLRARLEADAEAAARLKGRRVLAFAGIGRPEKFMASLRESGAEVVSTRAFADHAPMSSAEAAALLREAAEKSLLLVTTEKDHARMRGRAELAELEQASAVLPVRLMMEDEAALASLLRAALAD